MGWLLRRGPEGGRHHRNTLARVIDACGAAWMTARQVHVRITDFLAARHWEVHPDSIAYPLRWVEWVMRGWTLPDAQPGTSGKPGCYGHCSDEMCPERPDSQPQWDIFPADRTTREPHHDVEKNDGRCWGRNHHPPGDRRCSCRPTCHRPIRPA